MAWGKQTGYMMGDHQAQPGQVSEEACDYDLVSGPDQMTYRGYVPQRYIPPGQPQVHQNAGEEGDGTVPNNTDRGNYGHGAVVDSEVWAKDHSRRDITDQTPQYMPEHIDQKEYDPIKVTVVDRYADETVMPNIFTVQIGTIAVSAQGQPTSNGLTPIRILGRDPARKRALIYVPNFTSGGNNVLGNASTPVILTSENQLPQYGFSLTASYQRPVEVFTNEELWVAGQNAADLGVVSVYIERAVNADRLLHD